MRTVLFLKIIFVSRTMMKIILVMKEQKKKKKKKKEEMVRLVV
jgi:hypothetical protein